LLRGKKETYFCQLHLKARRDLAHDDDVEFMRKHVSTYGVRKGRTVY